MYYKVEMPSVAFINILMHLMEPDHVSVAC